MIGRAIIIVIAIILTLLGNVKSSINSFIDKIPLHKTTIEASIGEKENIVAEVNSEKEENIIVETSDVIETLEGDVRTFSKYSLPKIGEEVEGFIVKNIFDFGVRNAKVVEFEHIKTKAKAMLISNADEDKCFSLGFKTYAPNDGGIPHIFEHCSLGGSKKYPSENLFFEMVSKTYNTYMNAFTTNACTCFPASSLSDEQLFAMYKVYLDGVFQPNILEDKSCMEKEAYRYILNDKNGDLGVSGIVYSEMSGSEGDIRRKATDNVAKTIFPGSVFANNDGGEPSSILNVTHQELIDFHKKYYQPSNLLLTLYGDIDYKKYLAYVGNEYLVTDEVNEIVLEDEGYKPIETFVEKTFDFPVSNDTNVEKACEIDYEIVLQDLTSYEAGYFSSVVTYLGSEDGPIKKRLDEKMPGVSFRMNNGIIDYYPTIGFEFTNIDEEEKYKLKEIVEDALKELVENGIKEDVIEQLMDAIEYDADVEKDSHGFANEMTTYNYMSLKKRDGVLGYYKYYKGLYEVRENYNNGNLNKLISKYFSNNNHSAMVTTKPKKGLLEEKEKAFEDFLKLKKEQMTDKEIDDLVAYTKNFDKKVEAENKVSLIDKVRVASASGLDIYEADCYAYEENVEGIRIIKSDIKDIKYNTFQIMFDTSGIKAEDLHKLSLIDDMLLLLPTSKYKKNELKAKLDKIAVNYYTSISPEYYYNGGYKPYFTINITALDKRLDEIFDIIDELTRNVKFEDVDLFRSTIAKIYNNKKMEYSSAGRNLAIYVNNVKAKDDRLYENYTKELPYLRYLKEIQNMSDEDLEKLLSECGKLYYEKVLNRDGLTCELIGNSETIKKIKSNLLYEFRDLREEKIEPIDYSEFLPKYKKNTAIVINNNINFNVMGISSKDFKEEFSSKVRVIGSFLDSDVLYPEFRIKRSCYGATFNCSRDGYYIEVHNDPNIKETKDVLKDIYKMTKNMKISNVDLEDFKVSAYANYSYPLTKLQSAIIAVNEIMENCDDKRGPRYARYMQDIKETTQADVKKYLNVCDAIAKNGTFTTVGSITEIEKNKDLFDEIIYDLVE